MIAPASWLIAPDALDSSQANVFALECVCALAVTAVKRERRRWGGGVDVRRQKGESESQRSAIITSQLQLPLAQVNGEIYADVYPFECTRLHLWASASNDFFWREWSQICALNRHYKWRWMSEEIDIPLLMQPVPTRHAVINCWKNVVPKIVSLKETVASWWLRQ